VGGALSDNFIFLDTIKESGMVTVHQFRVWDITRDEYVIPSRKATAEFIRVAKGVIIPGTAEDVDLASLDRQERYDPRRVRC
jgi:hypothetical protein